jgi:uncharacterized protein (DUF1684 family)
MRTIERGMASRGRKGPLLAAVALLAAAAACGPARDGGAGAAPPELRAMAAEEIELQRAEKDERYRTDPDSPIPADLIGDFEGLSYFAIDEAGQHVVRLQRYDDPPPVRMVTTEGEARPAVKLGFVEFDLGGEKRQLQVYQLRDMSAESWGHLFLPFLDETSGRETYAAGRYIELAEGRGDWYLLDFNLAYFPLCAYGRTDYQCPRTPDENRLPAAVRAGERFPDATPQGAAADGLPDA